MRKYLISNYGRLATWDGVPQEEGSHPVLNGMSPPIGDDIPAKLFKPVIVNKYPALNIRIDKFETKLHYLHKLVALHFLLSPDEGQKFVIHKDYNKGNNYVENLAWATAKERGEHQSNNPNFVKVKSKPKYKKLSDARKALLIQKINDPGRKTRLKLLAKQFGISASHLYRIKKENN